jgi:hypothetical protein
MNGAPGGVAWVEAVVVVRKRGRGRRRRRVGL